MSNPHLTQTLEALELASETMPGSQGLAVASIQAQAALAVAYEQRTANLIALFNQDDISDVPYGYLLKTIKDRLDLP